MKNLGRNLRSDLILNSMVSNPSLGIDFYLWQARGHQRISKDKLIRMLECGVEFSRHKESESCY